MTLNFKAWLESAEKATKTYSADKRKRLDKSRDAKPGGTPDINDWSPVGVSDKLFR